ncbi:MAG: type IV pilin N-terminal domain-containing protein [Methanofollis sp.]|nr:type IV pilin N-terminal domain-containing protein [Methanofollis sp.]
MEEDEGISEVVASVLLIALTVVGVAIVATLLFSAPSSVEVPAVSLTAGTTADGTFVLIHEGGDPMGAGTYRVYVDAGDGLIDRTDRFLLDGDGAWSPGEALMYTRGDPGGRIVVTALVGGSETMIAEPWAMGTIATVVDEGGNTPGTGPGPGPGPEPEETSIEITMPSDGGQMIFSEHPKYSSTVWARTTGETVKSVKFILKATEGTLTIEGTYAANRGMDGEYYADITSNYGQLKKMTGRDVIIRAVGYDSVGTAVASDTVTAQILLRT